MSGLIDPTRAINTISNRLSLRRPQRECLEILARLGEILPLQKDQDIAACLAAVKSEFGSIEDFERDFPSVCFALATGVGKTRLMGASIAYLAQVHGLRHFMVLAPNLTIYNKLISEFSKPSHPKYVFTGIAEFTMSPPKVITGDDYDSGKALRRNLEEDVHINVFNISKINSEVRGGAEPRIRRFSEYIGTSYYEYLASLEDLVLLMDESHRYRASAGVKAINELKPILGLEMTATPKAAGANGAPFKNVIYSYPLASAMEDGFVKEPAVVTKENFRPQDYNADALELVKLEDGVRVHEHTKVELETYALQSGRSLVRPFMLVVAQDTSHADEIEALIKSDKFFEGRYADKVITVHSNQSGELKDDSVERLLLVERADSERAPEIVIHVNKLGEGWDVTNLYTIVPLRRFVADILTEQTLGRGLRLPYGRRTGNDAVDTLHIVAHDKFQEIIDEARNADSIIKKGVVIGKDIPVERKVAVTVHPLVTPRAASDHVEPNQQNLIYDSDAKRRIAEVTIEVVRQFEHLPSSSELLLPEVQSEIAKAVGEKMRELPLDTYILSEELQLGASDVDQIVAEVTAKVVELTIDVPRIVLKPKDATTIRFADFDLDTSTINLQPVGSDLVIESLPTGRRWTLASGMSYEAEEFLENYIVKAVSAKSDVDYRANADLLFKLAGQFIQRLRSYLLSDDKVEQVLVYHQQHIADFVHAQMGQHREVNVVEYEVIITKGFETLKPTSFDAVAGDASVDFRNPVAERSKIRSMSFTGFTKCLYPIQKFDSDPERRLAVVLENDDTVLKWFKPASRQFRISMGDNGYEPDFVVETVTSKYLIEPKGDEHMQDSDVLSKAEVALNWCKYATEHELPISGKTWKYLLVPDSGINATMTIDGLAATYELRPS